MLKTALIFVGLSLVALPAIGAPLVSDIAGHWETLPENCLAEAPSQGQRIDIDDTWEIPQLYFVNHATEGGTCRLDRIDDTGALLALGGRCGWEEGPISTRAFFWADVQDGNLSLSGDWGIDGKPSIFGAEISLHRCRAVASGIVAAISVAGSGLAPDPVEMPQGLQGQWETDTANCGTGHPDAGMHASFQIYRGDVVVGGTKDTPGGSCRVSSAHQVGRDIIVRAACRMEDGGTGPAQILASVDDGTLTLQTDWMASPAVLMSCAAAVSGAEELRKRAAESAARLKAEEEASQPMDLGLGN